MSKFKKLGMFASSVLITSLFAGGASASAERPANGDVGITSGPLCADEGQSNGSVTLYGPSGKTFTLTNGGGTWTIPDGQGYVEIMGLAAGTYKTSGIKIVIDTCEDDTPPSKATVDASATCTTVTVTSTKDISNVVVDYSDAPDHKYDGLSGYTFEFPYADNVVGVWIKSGDNHSGDGPGYGEYVVINAPQGCDTPPVYEIPVPVCSEVIEGRWGIDAYDIPFAEYYIGGVKVDTSSGGNLASSKVFFDGDVVVEMRIILNGEQVQTATLTPPEGCIDPVNPCSANLFEGYEDRGGLWEINYGRQHTDVGQPAVFTNDSFGGLVSFNGSATLPAYMSGPGTGYEWLYVYGDQPGRVWTWDFADGTRVTATASYSEDGCPVIDWQYGNTPDTTVPPTVIDVQPEVDYTPPSCDAEGTIVFQQDDRWYWGQGENGTFVVYPEIGYTFAEGIQTVFGPYALDKLTGEQCEEPTTPTTPTEPTEPTTPTEPTVPTTPTEPTEPTVTTAPPAPPAAPQEAPPSGALPETGAQTGILLAIALAALGGGLGLLFVSRRRPA